MQRHRRKNKMEFEDYYKNGDLKTLFEIERQKRKTLENYLLSQNSTKCWWMLLQKIKHVL